MALDLFFPQWCVGCGKEGVLVCPACAQSLPIVAPPLCPLCGLSQPSGVLCPNCISWQASIDGIRAPFRFEGTVRQAVHQLKYRNIRSLSEPLAHLLIEYVNRHPVPGDVLVPVPLHTKRVKERGYNQSALLAAELGKLSGLPIVDDSLERRVATSPQARTATVDERRKNVSDAFVCRDQRLRDRQVILIDDVSTSGATLNACASALKQSGAASVWGLTVARET
jgi:ComF family protein